MEMPRIAVDAMGGDDGVRTIVAGAALAFESDSRLRFLLIGDKAQVVAALARHPRLAAVSEIVHAPDVISGEEKPSAALRRARTTSMGLAIDAVKGGRAAAALSAGNTGALMAIAKLSLRTLPGIDRPALAALLPTLGANDVVMLDLGANTECDARNLVEFAIMGAAYSRIAVQQAVPRVRLLNIGTEEMKGTADLRDAATRLRAAAASLSMQFDGFTEADKLNRGEVDVVVTDGFSGNIALKAVEGTAKFISDLLRRSFASSIRSKIGFLISRPATNLLRTHLDPNNHNGAVFLGLNGIVVKSHGSASARGIAHAISVAQRLVEEKLIERITGDLARLGEWGGSRRGGGAAGDRGPGGGGAAAADISAAGDLAVGRASGLAGGVA